MAKLTAGIATHHVSGLSFRFAAGFMEAWPDNVNPSPIMQPPEPQLLTDLKCQVINWPAMNVHGGGEDRYELKPSGDKSWQCAVITGKSRMTNDEDFSNGKSFRGHLAITYRDEDKRTNLDGRRYRDRFRAFFL